MSNSACVWRQRGAVRLRNPLITFRAWRVSPWIYWASWPFGALELYKDSITVKAWPVKVSIHLDEIDYVEFQPLNPWRILLGDRLRILHHAPDSGAITFSWYGLRPTIDRIGELGVRIVTK